MMKHLLCVCGLTLALMGLVVGLYKILFHS